MTVQTNLPRDVVAYLRSFGNINDIANSILQLASEGYINLYHCGHCASNDQKLMHVKVTVDDILYLDAKAFTKDLKEFNLSGVLIAFADEQVPQFLSWPSVYSCPEKFLVDIEKREFSRAKHQIRVFNFRRTMCFKRIIVNSQTPFNVLLSDDKWKSPGGLTNCAFITIRDDMPVDAHAPRHIAKEDHNE